MASIRAHRDSNTIIITKNSSYTRPIVQRVNLIMGINARCMERVAIDGDLELGKKAEISGSVKANKAILGPGSIIYGDLTVEGDLMALDNAKVTGHVLVTGAAFIRPGVMFGSLDAGGLIEIQGKPPSKHIKGKMVVNDGTDYREPSQQKKESEAFKKPKEPASKGKAAAAKKKPQNKAKEPEEEKPRGKGFFGLFK